MFFISDNFCILMAISYEAMRKTFTWYIGKQCLSIYFIYFQNRPVYKAVKGSLILGYIKYNNKRWVLSKGVDGEAIIVSSETTLAEPFVIGISWR